MAIEDTTVKSTTSERAAEKQSIPCEVYSRVVGYLRPVQNWNKGKRQEFQERRTYRMPETDK